MKTKKSILILTCSCGNTANYYDGDEEAIIYNNKGEVLCPLCERVALSVKRTKLKENWKSIEHSEYFVSNLGNVRYKNRNIPFHYGTCGDKFVNLKGFDKKRFYIKDLIKAYFNNKSSSGVENEK